MSGGGIAEPGCLTRLYEQSIMIAQIAIRAGGPAPCCAGIILAIHGLGSKCLQAQPLPSLRTWYNDRTKCDPGRQASPVPAAQGLYRQAKEEDNMDEENQDQHKNPAFESLDILISRWKDGTFGEIIDDWKWIFT